MLRKLLLGLLVLMAFSPAFGQEVLVFVTSQEFNPDFGGFAGANVLCNNAAQTANLSGNWVAWISDDTQNARDVIIDAEYQLLDGTVIANDLTDLTDGDLAAPINIDETNTPIPGGTPTSVWTGTLSDGTVDSGQACNDWTDTLASVFGLKGDWDRADSGWTASVAIDCANNARLYCFSDFEVPVELQKFSVE